MAKSAVDTPVPMDDDDLNEDEDTSKDTSKADESAKAGYGPVRRRDGEVRADGIIFRPAQVDDVVVEMDTEEVPYEKPEFAPLNSKQKGMTKQLRRVPVPPHRLTPLKASWMAMIQPLVEHMKLQVRMNTKRRAVELRNSDETDDIGALQKGADYFRAFMLGFDQPDAVALLRLDDLFLESFEVKDVKRLQGEHLSRCIGRIAGKDGKTKYAMENATRTRISLCEDKIHILGSFANIKLARDSICSLILGSAPGKVYTKLRTVSKRLQD
jgi:RNA-binding protein PNO1